MPCTCSDSLSPPHLSNDATPLVFITVEQVVQIRACGAQQHQLRVREKARGRMMPLGPAHHSLAAESVEAVLVGCRRKVVQYSLSVTSAGSCCDGTSTVMMKPSSAE